MNKHSQVQTQRQTQKILPQQIHLLNLLQLTSLELEQRILLELEENPALETEDISADTEGGGTVEELYQEDLEMDSSMKSYDFDDDILTDYSHYSKQEQQRELRITHHDSFQETLKQQLALKQLDPHQRMLCDYLIDAIDDDGYLRRSLEDIADDSSFNFNTLIEEEDLEAALEIVQSLDPIGIGSRDLSEYVMFQLREMARSSQMDTSIACAIADGYLNDIAQKNFDRVKVFLSISDEELKQALYILSLLNPKPVSGLARPEDITQHIIPDFTVVAKESKGFDITVAQIGSKELRVNQHYNSMLLALEKSPLLTKHQKANAQYLKGKISAAQWFVEAIKQREDSLTRTIHTIVTLQDSFFKTGDFKKLRPMILKDVAERTGLDISTISRVTSSRYVQTDFGIIPLKELFTEGVLTEDGQWVSNRQIQETLLDIISEENKQQPFTDQELTHQLMLFNYNIARRTVAKYRESLNIPNAQARREL